MSFIPIRNIYYLFLYAWKRFPGDPLTDVGVDDSPDEAHLFAKLLLEGTKRLLHRGLDRAYETDTVLTQTIRGKLQLGKMLDQQASRSGLAVCDVDELSFDVLHNRILASTLAHLERQPHLERELRHEIGIVRRELPPIALIQSFSSVFQRVQLSRNARIYGLLMQICELLVRQLFPTEGGTSTRFNSVLSNEGYMAQVFEEFLRNFYRYNFPGYAVGSTQQSWSVAGLAEKHAHLIPAMRRDITIQSASELKVIEAKFYARSLSTYYDADRLRSGHLYQLMSYLREEQYRSPDRRLSGTLIYAQAEAEFDIEVEIWGIPARLVTLDLSRHWSEIEADLRHIVSIAS